MSIPSRVLIFTGTRAESGLLTPIARACAAHQQLDPAWLVSGQHLLGANDSALEELRADSIPLAAEVPFFEHHRDACKADAGAYMLPLALDMGQGGARISQALADLKPDWLVVLGDRVETFAASAAAYVLGIPICHLHGGDRIDSGHMDEGFRHAITRFASLHCAASEESANRIRKFGEEEWRIEMIGAPGLDRLAAIHAQIKGQERALLAEIGVPAGKDFLLVIYHPVSREAQQIPAQIAALMQALDARPEHKLVVLPNNDPGAAPILQALDARKDHADWSIEANLPGPLYAAALSQARAFVGNSSSGIIEAPLFAQPFVHVGTRNTGREHAGHVDFVATDAAAIGASIARAVTQEEHKRVASLRNPYGAGRAGEACAEALVRFAGDERLTLKRVTY